MSGITLPAPRAESRPGVTAAPRTRSPPSPLAICPFLPDTDSPDGFVAMALGGGVVPVPPPGVSFPIVSSRSRPLQPAPPRWWNGTGRSALVFRSADHRDREWL